MCIVKGVLGQFQFHLWSPWCVSNQGLSLHNLHGNPIQWQSCVSRNYTGLLMVFICVFAEDQYTAIVPSGSKQHGEHRNLNVFSSRVRR